MRILVVGANGQLGAACCRALVTSGHDVRGSVRRRDRAAGLGLDGVELVEADLATSPDLQPILDGVEAVVLTANAVAPRAGDDTGAFSRGMRTLVDATGRVGVQRIVLPSLPLTEVDDGVPLAAERRELEHAVLEAVPGSVILRFAPFMESWLALVGSGIPLRGEPNATVGRPSPFLQRFRRATGTMVEDHGLMLVPGPTSHRQAFITVRDVAAACGAALGRPDLGGQTLEVGGPQVLSWDEVAEILSRLLGRRVRALSTPTLVFAVAATVLRPIAPTPAGTLALNRHMGASETPWAPGGGGLLDPAELTTLEEFLTAKLALPATLPTVV
jgi:uncharacterized protein YbjT (DUF2867 family)